MEQKKTSAPIRNEATNRLQNKRATIAMARSYGIDTATSQFFINVSDNFHLDFKNASPYGFGYAVFGQVFKESMAVVDRINAVKTTEAGLPHKDIKIIKITILRDKTSSPNVVPNR